MPSDILPLMGVSANVPPARLLVELRALLGSSRVLTGAESTTPYECDALVLHRQRPPVVVLPREESEVAAVLRICSAHGVPVVPRGAGTGLSGGATPHAAGVLMVLAGLDRVLSIDPRSRVAIVQPGVRNLAISEAVAAYGLHYAPDPSSQVACTIGGNVAENSGGVHCLKYGLTLHNVLRLRGFTMAGEPVEFGSLAPDAAGLDMLALVLGSEGMLAVVTEVAVRLTPKPQLARCILAGFDDVGRAGDAVAALIAAGIIPAGLEMLDQAAVRLVEPFARAGYDVEAAAVLLCEADGTPEEVDEDIGRMSTLLRAAGATSLRVSADEEERLRFWAGRKNAFPAAGRAAPAYYCMDGTIPRRHLGQMLKSIQQMEQRYGLRCPNVFHAGDGNLHPLILFDDADEDSVRRALALGEEILEESIRLGGTVTGEHGVGLEKLDTLCLQFDSATREAFFAVKRAFDPTGLLNPGKAIPTLHRCAEFGRQRVRGGELPFAHLPRF
jgi:glycolate oxidase